MDSNPDVSLLMPAYNAADTIAASIEAVFKQDTSLSYEIIIVDDGSKDATSEVAGRYAKEHPEKIFFFQQENGGEAKALNTACGHARGSKFWAIVEADVEIPSNWISELSSEVAEGEVIGAGGMLLPDRKDSWIARLHGYEIAFKMKGRDKHVEHITSANAFYRREAFDIGGPYEENLVNSLLDVNFNLRVRDAGFKLAVRKDIEVIHHYKATLVQFLARNYAYARFRPWLARKVSAYPYDYWLTINILLTCAWMLSIVSAIWWWPVPLIGLGVLLLLQAPLSFLFIARFRDWAPILFPLVMWLRNSVAVVGLGIGTIVKFFSRKRPQDRL